MSIKNQFTKQMGQIYIFLKSDRRQCQANLTMSYNVVCEVGTSVYLELVIELIKASFKGLEKTADATQSWLQSYVVFLYN